METKKKAIWLSLKRAFSLTAAVYLSLEVAAIFVGDPVAPLLQRFPLAWILYWPKIFFMPNTALTDRDLAVCLVLNIAAYTLLIYAVTYLGWRRRKMEHNSNENRSAHD